MGSKQLLRFWAADCAFQAEQAAAFIVASKYRVSTLKSTAG